MADVTVKLSDGTHEVTVETSGAGGDALQQAEAVAVRLYSVASNSAPPSRPAGFGGWALSSDTERSPDE
ncbi:hypothetical protein H3146_07345 [Streptomyces sp. OF3]|uniref:Uncharacterized protein n=1 Tax=Streptomyces alkaliterrae TaxID=2213162 RepID=A0A7W3WJR9_9ACTN|nr:hypothetical protein [Streptomyces alkaliterrae]MBB1253185.1 hypothetical protein [Streptomyces alkaliterrae]